MELSVCLSVCQLTDRNGQEVSALSQIKYVATTSGGSWFNSALPYFSLTAEVVSLLLLLQMELTDRNGQTVSALSQIKYVATTSGGSWFNSALSYKTPLQGDYQPNSNLDTFLGRVLEVSKARVYTSWERLGVVVVRAWITTAD